MKRFTAEGIDPDPGRFRGVSSPQMWSAPSTCPRPTTPPLIEYTPRNDVVKNLRRKFRAWSTVERRPPPEDVLALTVVTTPNAKLESGVEHSPPPALGFRLLSFEFRVSSDSPVVPVGANKNELHFQQISERNPLTSHKPRKKSARFPFLLPRWQTKTGVQPPTEEVPCLTTESAEGAEKGSRLKVRQQPQSSRPLGPPRAGKLRSEQARMDAASPCSLSAPLAEGEGKQPAVLLLRRSAGRAGQVRASLPAESR